MGKLLFLVSGKAILLVPSRPPLIPQQCTINVPASTDRYAVLMVYPMLFAAKQIYTPASRAVTLWIMSFVR